MNKTKHILFRLVWVVLLTIAFLIPGLVYALEIELTPDSSEYPQ